MTNSFGKILSRVSILTAILALTAGASELHLERAHQASGEENSVMVRFASISEPLTGLQFDLEYDTEFLTVTAESGPAAMNADKVPAVRSSEPDRGREQ